MITYHQVIQRSAVVATAVLAVGVLSAVPATASGGGGGVSNSGRCSQGSTWNLEAKADDGRIEVEAEVETNVSGQAWTWRILHDGGLSAHGTSTTKGGSFKVERNLVNTPGTDAIGWRSTNTVTGEKCSGGLNF